MLQIELHGTSEDWDARKKWLYSIVVELWNKRGWLDLQDYKAHWEKKKMWHNKHFANKLLITYETSSLSIYINKIIKELS